LELPGVLQEVRGVEEEGAYVPIVIGCDPGYEQSAIVTFEGKQVIKAWKMLNEDLRKFLLVEKFNADYLAIEQVASFGMPVGREVFETVYWSGIFAATFGLDRVTRFTRITVKNHLCHSSRATDSAIRCAIIDKFGGKEKAIGRKYAPGPLHGIVADQWSALAVALTHWDTSPVCV
jgi:hypothetical protein